MRARLLAPSFALPICLAAVAYLIACAGDAPTAPDNRPRLLAAASAGQPVAVCHGSGSHAAIVQVLPGDLPAHLKHGDYVTGLLVSHLYNGVDDGVHFHRIVDALAVARAGRLARGELRSAGCRITIAVGSGVFRGTAEHTATGALEQLPIMVDVPDITLLGALVMRLDARGRATGEGVTARRTTLLPAEPLSFFQIVSTPIIIAHGHPHGSAGDGLVVEGFVFKSAQPTRFDVGGQGILSLRVKRLEIRGNRFEEGFSETIDLRATSAVIERNHLGGTRGTCDMCLAGPGTFLVTGNRLLAGGIPGITVSPVVDFGVAFGMDQYDLPASAETWADIRNNEVRDHLRIPTGAGIRGEAIGIGAPNVHGTIHMTIRDNLLVNNRFALLIHGAFPVPDTRLRGDVDVALGGNDIRGSCQADLFVALTRHRQVLGLGEEPWLKHSTYGIDLGKNLLWRDVWFGNEAGHDNRLIVNGREIPNGSRQFYSETSCPNLTGHASDVAVRTAGAR